MKKSIVMIGLFTVALLGLESCKNKENDLANKRISELESFVDSLKNVSSNDIESNWIQISADYDKKNSNAVDALAGVDEHTKTLSQTKLDASKLKYDELKVNMETKAAAMKVASNPSQSLRDRLFGSGKIGTDMNFDWVNKDNIFNVYDAFFQSYKKNKSDFTREDYDEVKLMYEALDSRKNTVENEGLSSEDNMKIASIKIKFGPMFDLNRIGAKARETSEAKE
jgi:hypothetical protein